MADTVLVTVAGPERRADLSVPADTPVEALLPSLLEAAGPEPGSGDSGRWEIGPPGGATLPEGSTLAQCGVVDGAVLALRPDAGSAGAAVEAPEPEPDPIFQPGEGTPLERARAALPRRASGWARVRQAAEAAFSRGDERRARETEIPDRAAGPRPAAVTVARSLTPMERARNSWRATDYTRRLERSITEPRLRRCATIAVMSPKGGVGKTTITALLGSLLAHVRRDRVVAVDTNPDYGSLGRSLTPDHDVFVDDLLQRLEQPDLTVAQLDVSLGRGPDGLLVLPAPTEPRRMARLDRAAYKRVIEHLQGRAGVLLLDCGTGLQEPAAQAATLTADQIVLVSDAEPATATLVAEASDLLLKVGAPLTLIVNKVPSRGARLDVDRLGELLPDTSAMSLIESNPDAAARVAAGEFTWSEPAGPWETTLRELATVIVSQWPALGLTAPVPGTPAGRREGA